MVSIKTISGLLLLAQCVAAALLIGLVVETFIQDPVMAAADNDPGSLELTGDSFLTTSTPTAAPTGSPAINGTVRYGNAIGAPASRFVSDVLLSASGSPNAYATTDFPNGNYSLTGLSGGPYIVTPTKTGGVNGSINSFDAARIGQHITGLNLLTGYQLTVADVSGNDTVSSFDAAQIARYVVSLPGATQTGTWKFILPSNKYSSVTGIYNDEDYLALLMGDVSGNWNNISTPTNTSTSTPTNTATVTPTLIPTPTGDNIALYPTTVYQTMRGWEANGQAGQLFSPAWDNYKNALLDQAVNDLGINRVRLEIISGVENPTDYFTLWRTGQITESQYNDKRYEIINDNANANVINASGFKWGAVDEIIENVVLPLKQRLAARGETLWINVCYVDFDPSPFEHKDDPAEYAEFVLASYQHIQSKYGFIPDSWEAILEPDLSSWSAAETANGIKAAGDALAANGFTPRFVAPSVTNAGNAAVYINQIAATSGAMAHVNEFSYHRYSGGTVANVTNIANLADTHNKQVGMLEKIAADHHVLHEDLKAGRNSSWQQYCLAGPTSWGSDSGDRYYVIDDANPSAPVIIMGRKTKLLRQYFKFIRTGARRIEALTGNSNFDPVAFINANGKYVVVVKVATSGAFNVQGLPAGLYGIKYTAFAQYNIDLPDISITNGQTLSTTMPDNDGVITIYAK